MEVVRGSVTVPFYDDAPGRRAPSGLPVTLLLKESFRPTLGITQSSLGKADTDYSDSSSPALAATPYLF